MHLHHVTHICITTSRLNNYKSWDNKHLFYHSSCKIEPLKKILSFYTICMHHFLLQSCMIHHLSYVWNYKQSNLWIYLVYTEYRSCYGCARLIYKDLITVMILSCIVISYLKRKKLLDLYITLLELLVIPNHHWLCDSADLLHTSIHYFLELQWN